MKKHEIEQYLGDVKNTISAEVSTRPISDKLLECFLESGLQAVDYDSKSRDNFINNPIHYRWLIDKDVILEWAETANDLPVPLMLRTVVEGDAETLGAIIKSVAGLKRKDCCDDVNVIECHIDFKRYVIDFQIFRS